MGGALSSMIRRVLSVVVMLVVLLLVWYLLTGEGDSPTLIDERIQSVAVVLPESLNLTSDETAAVIAAVNSPDILRAGVRVTAVERDTRTKDYQVFVTLENVSLVIIVRNETRYAYSVNGAPLVLCRTDPDSLYC